MHWYGNHAGSWQLCPHRPTLKAKECALSLHRLQESQTTDTYLCTLIHTCINV
jgi:hypothetical protein